MVTSISDAELGEIHDFAVQLGKDAGQILMGFAQARYTGTENGQQKFDEKDSAVDIVTKADEGAFLLSTHNKRQADHGAC
jgi:myo-inositol-1(or 4)-monophosphatase